MSLDDLIRSASEELRHSAAGGTDLDVDLVRLKHDSLRRTRTHRLAGVAVVVVVALLGWLAVRPEIGTDRPPVGPKPSPTPSPTLVLRANGPIMTFGTPYAGPGGGSLCRVVAVDPVTATSTPEPTAATYPRTCNATYVWSPDGGEVAELNGDQDSLTVREASNGTQLLTRSCHLCIGVSWSPDGTEVALGTRAGLLVVDVTNGSERTLVAGKNIWSPTWSPDGRNLAYLRWMGPYQMNLEVIRADGTGQRTLVPPSTDWSALQVAWSPSGSQLAVMEIGSPTAGTHPVRVMSVDPDSGVERTLLDNGARCYCVGGSPTLAWSPDSTALVMNMPGTQPSGQWGMSVMAADGSGLHRLTGPYGLGFFWWRPAS